MASQANTLIRDARHLLRRLEAHDQDDLESVQRWTALADAYLVADSRSLSMRVADRCRCGNCGHKFALGRGIAAKNGELSLVCPECLRGDNIMYTQTEPTGADTANSGSVQDSLTAWLIECEPPLGDTLYFCADGDWCNNPNHAHKFATAEEANAKRVTMQVGERFRVAEHEWPTDSEAKR